MDDGNSAAACGFCGAAWPCKTCALSKRLGKGAYGDVFAARVAGRDLALKVMPVDADSALFPVVEHGTLMELVHCGSRGIVVPLRAWLHPSSHTLSVAMPRAVCDVHMLEVLDRPALSVVAAIAKGITSCLVRMHRRHFMHRDVTSKNVLILEDGSVLMIVAAASASVGHLAAAVVVLELQVPLQRV